ncbi:type IV secretion system protein [Klebsiella pneumoniae]
MSGIFVGLNSHIMEGFDSVLTSVAADTGGWMAHLFSVAVLSLYITWRAYQTMAGKLVRPFEEIVWDVSRMLIIMIFVTNAGGYLDLGFGCHHRPAGRIQRRRVDLGAAGYRLGKGSSTWGEALLL